MNMELKSKLDETKRLLDTLRDENLDTVTSQIVNTRITTSDCLKGVVSLIFDKAVADDYLNCPLYARLCSALITILPSFPSHGGNVITFKGLLVKKVQDGFDCSGQIFRARDRIARSHTPTPRTASNTMDHLSALRLSTHWLRVNQLSHTTLNISPLQCKYCRS
ncbi:eukaryotic translation initiation factor [Tanacetum coccineum]